MNETAPGPAKKSAKHRSPAYPGLDLKAAIERARSFYHHEKRSSANVAVAVQHWGYSPSSSGGRQTLAALISYGLLEDKGSGDQRSVTLSDLALRILLDDRPDSIERADAIRRAALLPKIHSELFSKWPSELPSNPNRPPYLLIETKFNENSVDDFISQLRTTADFARIYATHSANAATSSALSSEDEEQDTALSETPIEPASVNRISSGTDQPTIALVSSGKPAGGGEPKRMRQDALSLDEGQVVLQWPDRLSETSFQDLSDWLELQLRRIKRNLQSE